MLDWLIDFDKPIFDVGCGGGYLIKELNQIRPSIAYGIDLLWDWSSPDIQVIPSNAVTSSVINYINDTLVLFCRPSHGVWVEKTINRFPSSNTILYIGLDKNVKMDIGSFDYQIVAHKGASTDNESVYQIML